MALKDRFTKLNKALFRTLSALFAFVLLLCGSAAALSPLDPSRGTELTVEMNYDGLPLPGASFSIYRVGSIDENANLALDAAFSGFDISEPETRSDWDQLARKMAEVVKSKQIEPIKTGKTDAAGRICFGSGAALSSGLYLVVGDELVYQSARYTSLPFLVTLPSWNAETHTWDYAVSAVPKLEKTTEPTPTPTPSPTPTPGPSSGSSYSSKLPQTGLLWWPVPVLLLLGLTLIVCGLFQRKRS